MTAYNSSRIHFLYPAALNFLNHLRTVKTQNRLEQSVLSNLQDKVMKLSDYKKYQLPGGNYWIPTAEEKEILQKLAPNNDVCESVLGLNDWITTHTPNLCQVTKSTLTMTWLDSLTEDKRSTIVNIAQRKRR